MKKFFVLITMFFVLFSVSVQASTPTSPEVSADGAILLDANSGAILYSKNINGAYPPASTTKIMTALLTLENCKLDDIVTIGKNPPLADGSKIYILEGETLTIEQLLHGLLLSSANDCAEALAEHVGGSINGFAQMMNKRAKELGCENSNFVNPSGLYNDKHKTSAKDLALIMKELVSHPEYTKIAKTNSYKIPPTNKNKVERPLWNENRLIQSYSTFYYNFCEGGKTGYTTQSLHSYVASASNGKTRLIVALIHDGNKTFFRDAPKLFKYGFENFDLLKLYSKGEVATNYKINNSTIIPLVCTEDFFYNVPKDTKKDMKYELRIKENLKDKSFRKGDFVTKATVLYDKKSLGTIDLNSGSDYESKKTFGMNISTTTDNFTKSKLILPLSALLAIGLLFIYNKKSKKHKYKHRKRRS